MKIDVNQILQNSAQMFGILKQAQDQGNNLNNNVIKTTVEEKVAKSKSDTAASALGGNVDIKI